MDLALAVITTVIFFAVAPAIDALVFRRTYREALKAWLNTGFAYTNELVLGLIALLVFLFSVR